MQSIREVLTAINAEIVKRVLIGDREGAIQAATAGKNICEAADKLGIPLDAPIELLEAVCEALGMLKTPTAQCPESTNEAA